MAYETKVILTLLSEQLARVDSVKEAYGIVVNAANAEGLQLPTYDEKRKEIEQSE